jgi:hypothetical protein
MKRHMARVAHLYGPLVAVNLAEQTGKEGCKEKYKIDTGCQIRDTR